MAKIKTIFFDLGQVIVHYDTSLFVKGFNEYGKVDEDNFDDYLWDSKEANNYSEGKITSSQFYTKTKRIFKLKIKYGEFYDVWNGIFWPYPEVEEIIRNIKEKYPDIRLVLVSNTNEEHFESIKKKYDILKLFDEFIVSYEVGKQKPHSKIFRVALKAGQNTAKETFYTDDMEKFIQAARTMGIRAFQFTNHNALRDQLAKFDVIV